ncbi:MAG: sugar phosphate isomerase/epimerase, partial [Candidatus Latescibacteria bacterium]|nr:sugar phosphate isomerase/epimerase [Candidatus Latescibacterota bacterium]
LILFSKMLKEKTIPELAELGPRLGLEGYDLCVRPGYPVSPDNAATELAKAVRLLGEAGLAIPMVTGNFDLLRPDHPTAAPLLAAMEQAGVGLLKLGYFGFDPLKQDYWQEVEQIRRAFEAWEKLGARHGVKVCYHTHSHRCMGLNAGTMAHLLRGFDPRHLGAYLDPGHLVVEGEEFAVALAILRDYLSIFGIKDVRLDRVEKEGHGSVKAEWVEAGQGMVDWTTVFADLKRIAFAGPLSVHCEFHCAPDQFLTAVQREVQFFRTQRALVQA